MKLIRSQYWKLRFQAPNAEELASILLSSGANGAEIESDNVFSCFIDASESDRDSLLSHACALGAKLILVEPVSLDNWAARCEEVWETVLAGKLCIVPVNGPSADIGKDFRSSKLFIIPGMGFGTGHHASTRLALELLQHEEVQKNTPRNALDVGTGSGILAIACEKLYGARLAAFDNDHLALRNACENISLNHCSCTDLFIGEISAVGSVSFDLIIANIYAEALIEMREDFAAHAHKGSFLILSGIQKESAKDVRRAFSEAAWQNVESREDDNWAAFLFQK